MLLFIDVDGTLVDYENNLPESAVTAIRQARANGHKVYICTGRSKAEVYDNIWDIGLDGMIGGNGSYVEDHGHVVMHTTLSKEDCTQIVDWLLENGLEFYLESNNGLFASPGFARASEESLRLYAQRKGVEDTSRLRAQDIFPTMVFDGELYRDDVNKISFLLHSLDDYQAAKERFAHLKVNTWGGKGEEALFGDVGIPEADKAKSIECLLAYLGAKQEDTIAFGDAGIDIPMLEYCQIGVAMNSGGKEIKAMADHITDDVDRDGLYKAFRHFGLIG